MKNKLPAFCLLMLTASLLGCDNSDGNETIVERVEEEIIEEVPEEIPLVNSLKEAGEQANKLVGTAISSGVISSGEEEYLTFVANEFNYTTPENIAKWGSLQPNNSSEWQFDKLDSMLDLIESNNQLFKGHALVWHRQAPNFINDDLTPSELSNLITAHISQTAGRYQGRIYAWDVVNEVIDDDANYRDSVFYRVMGKDYIAQSFIDAKAADPEAKLFYNDYGITVINAKSDAVYEMVTELIANEVPIDGVGFQMHIEASTAPTTQAMIDNLQRFADLGLTVNISELDVRVSSLPWNQATKLAIQKQVYHRATTACMAVEKCESISTWGFTDKYTWIDGEFGADDPLLLDENYQQKPAYFGVADALSNIVPDDISELPNLVANGHAETHLTGWTVSGGKINRDTASPQTGNASIKISERTLPADGLQYEITNVIESSHVYSVSTFLKVVSSLEQTAKLGSMITCESGEQHIIEVQSITSQTAEWVELSGEIMTPDCEIIQAELLIDGPDTGIDFLVDGLSLRPTMLVANTDGFGENLVINSDLEADTSGWYGFGDPIIERIDVAPYAGEYSGIARNRLDTWQGVAYGVTDIIEAGKQYQLLGWVKTSEGAHQIRATLKLACPSGDQYIGIGGANANESGWQLVAGQMQVPNCAFTQAEIYFEGPSAGVDILFDEVTLHKKDEVAVVETTLVTTNFETDFNGWFTWGDAEISLSNADANTGTQSALVSNRTETWQGPVFDLAPLVQSGQTLSVSGFGKVYGADTDTLQITFKTVCSGESEQYSSFASTQVTSNTWLELAGTFTLPDCSLDEVLVYFDGASIGVDILIDDIKISTAGITDNLISNAGFEQGVSPWVAWGDASVIATDEYAHSGMKSAQVTNRTDNWQSAVYDLLSVVEPDQIYDTSLFARIAGTSTADLSITLKTRCDGEAETYNGAGITQVNDSNWVEVKGQFRLPACTLAEAFIYFDGPDAGIDIFIDDVAVTLVNQ